MVLEKLSLKTHVTKIHLEARRAKRGMFLCAYWKEKYEVGTNVSADDYFGRAIAQNYSRSL